MNGIWNAIATNDNVVGYGQSDGRSDIQCEMVLLSSGQTPLKRGILCG